ncbi:unnamed protein product [Rhizophagus irregularis]|nr:unnamed protein product [Rhizophagus irregularis]
MDTTMINAPPQINNITVTPVEILLEFWSLYSEETFGDKDDEVGDKNDEVFDKNDEVPIAIGGVGVANANNLADDKDVAGAVVANANNLAVLKCIFTK